MKADVGRNPRFAHVTMKYRGDGDEKAGSAHVNQTTGAERPDLHTWSSMRRTTGQKPTICTRDWQPSTRLIVKSRGIEYICGGNYFQTPADNMDGMLRQVADR